MPEKRRIDIDNKRERLITAAAVGILMTCASVGITSAALEGAKSLAAERTATPDSPDIPAVVETIDTPELPAPKETEDIPATPDEPEPTFVVHTYDKLPEKYVIKDVGHIIQYDKLITGCELVSTKVVLDYYGFDKITLDTYVKSVDRSELKVNSKGVLYGKSPYQAFIGNPKRVDGFGCFPPVICNMVNGLELERIYTEDTTEKTLDELCQTYIVQDVPILIWVTDGMGSTCEGDCWNLVDDKGKITTKVFVWPLNEHCVVLMGYDKNNYYLSDPLAWGSPSKYNKQTVNERYKELGSMSAVIWKDRAYDNKKK